MNDEFENIDVPEYAKEAIEKLKETEDVSKKLHEKQKSEEEQQQDFNNMMEVQRLLNYSRPGFRQIGHRKQHLMRVFDKELAKLHKRGINTKYLVRKLFKIRNTNSITTKELTGLISKIKQFSRGAA